MQRLSALSKTLTGSFWQQAACAQCACSFSATALVAQPPQPATACDVPAGHENSDLRNSVCNISLNRRRDISLRSDVKFYTRDDEPLDLRQLLKRKNKKEGAVSVLFGVPDMGKVCSEQHAPGYLKQMYDLGVAQIFAVGIGSPDKVYAWADKMGLNKDKICALADKQGAFARMLGVEINPVDESPPHCHRYAAIVEYGILIKLRIEDDNGNCDSSSADGIIKILEEAQARREVAKGRKE